MRPCAICETAGRQLLYELETGRLERCSGCGTVQRANLVEGTAAEALYDDDSYLEAPYFEAVKAGAPRNREPYLVYRRVLDRLAEQRSGAPAGRSGRGRLLDLGCSYGAFLELASEVGWRTFGIELSRKASEYAARERGLEVFRGTLEEAALPEASFDTVTLWDVIEHLDRPLHTVRQIHRLLAPGGTLVLFTINQRSLINRVGDLAYRGTLGRWRRPLLLLYDIHHNFFFDPRTLRGLLVRGGFEDVEVDWLEAHIERWQNVPIPRLLALGSDALDVASRYVGERYRMIVYARKAVDG